MHASNRSSMGAKILPPSHRHKLCCKRNIHNVFAVYMLAQICALCSRMLCRCILLTLACNVLLVARAALLGSLPTREPTRSHDIRRQTGRTTPAPEVPAHHELFKKRQDNHNTCGYTGRGDDAAVNTCIDTNAWCAASIFQNGQAYLYCSTSGAVTQWVGTTAYANYNGTSCPTSAYCWYVAWFNSRPHPNANHLQSKYKRIP